MLPAALVPAHALPIGPHHVPSPPPLSIPPAVPHLTASPVPTHTYTQRPSSAHCSQCCTTTCHLANWVTILNCLTCSILLCWTLPPTKPSSTSPALTSCSPPPGVPAPALRTAPAPWAYTGRSHWAPIPSQLGTHYHKSSAPWVILVSHSHHGPGLNLVVLDLRFS